MQRRQRLTPAIDHYHSLISRDFAAAEQQMDELIHLQKEQGLVFGGRPLATSLRPTFLNEQLYNEVQDSVYMIRQAVLCIAAAFFKDRQVLVDDLGMEEWELELAALPTDVIRLSATARFDSFLTEDSFKFVEINAEVPAGPAYIHHLGHLFRTLPLMKEFERSYPVRFVSPLEHLVASLTQIYHQEFDGKQLKPTFAIVDMLNVPTYTEFILFKQLVE